jgi:hypothetical protein
LKVEPFALAEFERRVLQRICGTVSRQVFHDTLVVLDGKSFLRSLVDRLRASEPSKTDCPGHGGFLCHFVRIQFNERRVTMRPSVSQLTR